MTQQITHHEHGDQVLVTVRFGRECLTALTDGSVELTMEDSDWKVTARGVLKECNAIENELDPNALMERIRASLVDASMRGLEPMSPTIARMRMASTVLHRIADMVQSGTVAEMDVVWRGTEKILVSFVSRHGLKQTISIELGRGITHARAPEFASVDGPAAAGGTR